MSTGTAVDATSSATDTKAVREGFLLVGLACVFSMIAAWLPFLDSFNCMKFKISESKSLLASAVSIAAGVLIFLSLTDVLSDGQAAIATSNIDQIANNSTVFGICSFLFASYAYIILKAVTSKLHLHAHPVVQQQADEEQNVKKVEIDGEVPVKSFEEDSGENGHGSSAGLSSEDKKHLHVDAKNIATALAIHNFPEGLLLFLTTYESPTIGIPIAIGLIFHKFPEGLIISLPYYYSTGKPLIGFLLSLLAAGVFQFLGAIIGYVIILRASNVDSSLWGCILSLVSGVLFSIGLCSLYPQALRLDPQDKVRTISFFMGVTIIALSEMILSITS